MNKKKRNYGNELKDISSENLKSSLNKLIEAYNAKNN